MIDGVFHPSMALIVGGLALPWLRGHLRTGAVLLLPLVTLLLVWQIPEGASQMRFLDYNLTPLQSDKLSRLFGPIFALMAFGGGALRARSERPDWNFRLPSSMPDRRWALMLAGDLLTVFVFWELMAIGSTLVLWSNGTNKSYQASLAT